MKDAPFNKLLESAKQMGSIRSGKRPSFRVTCTEIPDIEFIRHSFNRASDACPAMLRLHTDGSRWTRISATIEKPDGFHAERGTRVWRDDITGKCFHFLIEKCCNPD